MRRFFLFSLVAIACVGGASGAALASSGFYPQPMPMDPFTAFGYCDYSCRAVGGPGFTPFATLPAIGQMPPAFGDPRVAAAQYLNNYGAQPLGPAWDPALAPAVGLPAVNANLAAAALGI